MLNDGHVKKHAALNTDENNAQIINNEENKKAFALEKK